jgi:Na+-driven multidrug efflux pump
MVFINVRGYFYNSGFPEGSITEGTKAIGVAAVLSLTSAILNIFTTTFNAIGTVCSKFVGGELGKNNIDKAKKNGKELKGFLTTLALFLAILLFLVSLTIPYMNFLVGGDQKNPQMILEYVQYTI